MSKLRILCTAEASFTSSGFSTISLELISRLHATGKYEIAELGCNCGPNDARALQLPWKFYNNAPVNDNEREVFRSHNQMEYGLLRFHAVCLDFKPHVVIDLRDGYMQTFLIESPFRQFFKLCLMPPIDGLPQDEHWVSLYKSADYCFAYTDWGKQALESMGIKVSGVTPPGADPVYQIIGDKKAHKEAMGLSSDSLVIGTVMRNQRRKLYPDLIESFAKLLKTARKELSDRCFLYLHCAYPDVGWKIGDLLLEHGVASRTIMTYQCLNCGQSFPSLFSGAKRSCYKCGQYSATTSNSNVGASRETLCKIYNLMDVYIQYSTCEGFGLILPEAAACGVQIIAVDHSAMTEVCTKLGGELIPNQRPWTDPDSYRILAYPDNDVLVSKLISILSEPEAVRLIKGKRQEKVCRELYSYDESAAKWMGVLDDMEIEDKWDSPNTAPSPAISIPTGLSNEEFVNWAMVNIARRPELLNSYLTARIIRDLNVGLSYTNEGGFFVNDMSETRLRHVSQPFDRACALKEFERLWNDKAFWECERCKIKR